MLYDVLTAVLTVTVVLAVAAHWPHGHGLSVIISMAAVIAGQQSSAQVIPWSQQAQLVLVPCSITKSTKSPQK